MTYDNTEEVKAMAQKHGFQMRLIPMTNTHHATYDLLPPNKINRFLYLFFRYHVEGFLLEFYVCFKRDVCGAERIIKEAPARPSEKVVD